MMTLIKHPLWPNEHIASQRSKQLYKWIRTTSEISKVELLSKCNMTPSTLNRTLDELLTTEIIIESRFGLSTGGRRPILYQVNANYGCAVGLDISNQVSRLVLVDIAGLVCASAQCLMTSATTPEVLIEWVVKQIELWKQQYIVRFKYWIGLGIGTFGILTRTSGIIKQLEWNHASSWSNVTIGSMLEHQVGMPVLLDNGANSCITAEVWENKAYQDEDLLYIHADSSISCAMILDGKLFFDISQIEGSLGHMIIQAGDNSEWKDDGNSGRINSYATVYAIQREANYRLSMGAASLIKELLTDEEQEVQLSHILEAARLQDATAIDLLSTAANYLGIGLANLINIMHPDKVIIGGPLSSSDLYVQTAVNAASPHIYPQAQQQVSFARESLGEYALAIGSALLVLEQHI